ncbi:MAG: dihydrolipoyl dehydrogenase [Alistipes sp.]|jgi:dihydrolipoamide dehydrogenase|nr:dihydrolipoyl dehydrogenase [Alistipes sp.]MBQ1957621.1 dihydrolipoyl dehydrogenase [Alistipes sp.]MBQ1980190.1 dihydrolipoyl dehydrogenase [Alistipes sp.]MBQ5623266.1 dihydrolipoyl dehydrogenase [Alistipes sp.]MBQ5784953.1 dihydrolipoyl dehydrogenase [Alistipes sp.]
MYDIIIIGSGPGGYVAAIRASQLGKKVALVEKAELGGVCLNWGCIPTKALLKSAQVYTYCKNAAHYGVEITGEVKPDFEKIVARSRTVAETMSKGVAFLMKKNNIEIIPGFGKIAGKGKVDVDGVVYETQNIILATGARPRQMPFMPIDGEHVISSKEALTLTKLPESMIVVGSGAIGSELASLYASLGVKTTIIEYMPQIMPLEDEEVAKAMERSFRKIRATVMTSTTVKNVTVGEDGLCHVEIEGKKGAEELTAEVVLSAVGIKSNIENIGLEENGINVERDKVVVDEHYQTSLEGVYAIGDIVAGPALAHVASAEAIHCVEHICGLNPEKVDYSTIPSCIFTSPEVASVGMTEKQAVEAGIEYKVGRFPFTASGKATAAGDRDGFAKLIFDNEEKLIGAHLVGANVTEMLGEPTLAKRLGITAHTIARTIHSHPTMHEGVMEAAEAAMGVAIHV